MANEDSHVIAKCISTLLLFGATVLFGLLPLRFMGKKEEGKRVKTQSEPEIAEMQAATRRRKLFLSLCNCFAGGVFFSTCILDLLPVVRHRMEEAITNVGFETSFPMGEFVASFGFLMMLLTEQVVHICSHGSISLHDTHHEEKKLGDRGVNTPLLLTNDDDRDVNSYGTSNGVQFFTDNLNTDFHDDNTDIVPASTSDEIKDSDCLHDIVVPETCRGPKTATSVQVLTQTNFRIYILIFALSLHSIFEGLSLGLVTGMDTLMQLIVAMSIHKCILAFSLGVSLVDGNLRKGGVIKGIILFAAMAPVGMGIGLIVLSSFSRTINLFFSGILQGIATGTFLYVTFFEILPHELNLTGPSRYLMIKSIFVVLGFAVIASICYFENKFHQIKKIIHTKP